MKSFRLLIVLIATLCLPLELFAETWDEPWQKEVIKKADYFILASVRSIDSAGAKVDVVKSFGGNSLHGTINISGFYMLDLKSSSGRGLHFPLEEPKSYYLFLKKGEGGSYSLPTPTSGYAPLEEGKVMATYRHSYHQALVSQEIYEDTYTEIWSYFKSKKFDRSKVSNFIEVYLSQEPAGFDEEEIETFFLQHVALETAFLLDMNMELGTLKKFIETDNFHSRVSALQLLRNDNSVAVAEYLFNFISDKKNGNFEKVIAIRSLWEVGGEAYQKKLMAMQRKLSDEETGFGGNIMDPRVATSFPSPRQAVLELSKSKIV
ncbi:hypothetical protein ACFQ2O_03630 [Pontibacter rugosus]|uniref:DUF4369 domain-containing protein n=2 Tax=Pontibacter rugosus TaxID=1745966 RepID=A0ABW3SP36_9BACT